MSQKANNLEYLLILVGWMAFCVPEEVEKSESTSCPYSPDGLVVTGFSGPFVRHFFPKIGVNFQFTVAKNQSDHRLPSSACLVLRLYLKTGPKSAPVTLDKNYINLAGWNLTHPSRGELTLSKDNVHLLLYKPFRSHLSVSAILNVGWCSLNYRKEYVRPGDYITDSIPYIKEDSESQTFNVDIQLSKIKKL